MRKINLLVGAILLLTSCQKVIQSTPENTTSANQNPSSSSIGNKAMKLTICHRSASGGFNSIVITQGDLAAHLAHGDVVPDADGDGYTKANPCGIGSQNDCDDTNAAINPGAQEICDNGIDDNCNGQADENCIPSVTICNQTWMAKNLDVSKYRNGDEIPQITDGLAWESTTTGAWCYYNNDPATGAIYGKIYNWYAVNDSRGLAPAGWHIASDEEWTTLTICLGGETVAGGALKEVGTAHWMDPNADATNSSGFTALGAGGRGWDDGGLFEGLTNNTTWWSSTEASADRAYDRGLTTYNGYIFRFFPDEKHVGASVRCVKD